MEHFCIQGPGDVQGDRIVHGDESTAFVADCYSLDDDGRLLYDSAFLSRPKGADKSGLGARFAMFESLGPCRFAGFADGGEVYEDPWGLGFRYHYQPGEPMGRHVTSPYVRILATEEGQTGNVYDAIWVNFTEGPLSDVPGLNVGLTRTLLPGGGEITPSTASGSAKDGGKETFAVFDETHLYNTPELRRMYKTVTRNLRKRKKIAGTWYLETTTMFAPGENSTAEGTYLLAGQIKEGKTRRERLLFDHRYGECEDPSVEDQLRAAIIEAFGEAIEWNDVSAIVDEFYDPRASTSDSRRYFLNSPTSSEDSWLTDYQWAARVEVAVLADGDTVTLGFDGSRGRGRGKPDATALIGCRVSDGHVFQLGVWEADDLPHTWQEWKPPVTEIEATVSDAFRRFRVVGFFADPALWWDTVARWEATYGPKLKVKATRDHPIGWNMGARSQAMPKALEQFYGAITEGEMTHSGEATLTRHMLNAIREPSRFGLQIRKETTDSPKKIDAAVAATLAWQARLQAVAAGITGRTARAPGRIR